MTRALQREDNRVCVDTLFALPMIHPSLAMKPDCPHDRRAWQSQEGPQGIGQTQCDPWPPTTHLPNDSAYGRT